VSDLKHATSLFLAIRQSGDVRRRTHIGMALPHLGRHNDTAGKNAQAPYRGSFLWKRAPGRTQPWRPGVRLPSHRGGRRNGSRRGSDGHAAGPPGPPCRRPGSWSAAASCPRATRVARIRDNTVRVPRPAGLSRRGRSAAERW